MDEIEIRLKIDWKEYGEKYILWDDEIDNLRWIVTLFDSMKKTAQDKWLL